MTALLTTVSAGRKSKDQGSRNTQRGHELYRLLIMVISAVKHCCTDSGRRIAHLPMANIASETTPSSMSFA